MPLSSLGVDDTANMAHCDAAGRGRPLHRLTTVMAGSGRMDVAAEAPLDDPTFAGPSPAFTLAGSGQTGRLDGPDAGDEKAVSRPEGHAARRRRSQDGRLVCGRSCRRPGRAHCHGALAGLPGSAPTTGTSIPSSDATGETSRKAGTANPGARVVRLGPADVAEHVAHCLQNLQAKLAQARILCRDRT